MKLKYFLAVVAIVWGILGGRYASAQVFNYEPDVFVTPPCSVANIKAQYQANGWPMNVPGNGQSILLPTVGHGLVDVMTNANNTYFQTCQNWNSYLFKSLQDYVKVKIDKSSALVANAFEYTFTFSITPYTTANVGATPNISGSGGGAPGAQAPVTASLTISYDPAAGVAYKDVDMVKIPKGHKIDVRITAITQRNGVNPPTPVYLSTLPDFIQFEAGVIAQRVDNIGNTIPVIRSATYNVGVTDNNLKLSWGFPCSIYSGGIQDWLPQPKSVEYELEWLYVDDYQVGISTNAFPETHLLDAGSISNGSIGYNFKNNSTRVRLHTSNYSIPIIYERGAIVYRVRTVRPNPADYTQMIYGAWSIPDNGTVTAAQNDRAFKIDATNEHRKMLNWQYSINFAEEGKYKHVINYLDGSLKNRQTQTKINTDADYIIAVDRAFDYEGRAAINSLPVPVKGVSKLDYLDNVLVKTGTNSALSALKASDFDDRNGSATSCVLPADASGLSLANGNSASPSLAELYYSKYNPLIYPTVTDNMHQFVPQAEGYPFVQTVLAPENPKKVLAQGGAGPVFQVSQAAHPTVYDYMLPTQYEIDRLLGSEAGKFQFYPKTVTTDPNGQASITVLNKYGKPVISSLAGLSPTALTSIDNAAATSSTSDLLKNFEQKRIDGVIKAENSFYLDVSGSTTGSTPAVGLKYDVSVQPFLACGWMQSQQGGNNICTNCTFLEAKASYNLNVLDGCGGNVANISSANGGLPMPKSLWNTGIGYGFSSGIPAPLTYSTTADNVTNLLGVGGASMAQGKYSFTKKLTFNQAEMADKVEDVIRTRISQYGQTSAGGCRYTTEPDFIRQEVEKIDEGCAAANATSSVSNYCDEIRKKMKDELLPKKKYGQYTSDPQTGIFISGANNSVFQQLNNTVSNIPNLPSAITGGVWAQDAMLPYCACPSYPSTLPAIVIGVSHRIIIMGIFRGKQLLQLHLIIWLISAKQCGRGNY